jgi:DNA mismatch repair protein MutS
MSDMARKTPMMEQYTRIKRENRDSILLFRLGDFYEMFKKDAVHASKALNITLTKRNGIPMCGFPFHAADTYIAKLLAQGCRVAICEQTEDPSQARGIVRREVVEIMSPGIITDPDLLDNKRANCIAALICTENRTEQRLAISSLDVSTGEFVSSLISDGDVLDHVLNEIEENGIREIIHPEQLMELALFSSILANVQKVHADVVFRSLDNMFFDVSDANSTLKEHFGVNSTDVFELRDEMEIAACGSLLSYVMQNVKRELKHVQWVKGVRRERALFIDNATKKHLELTQNQTDGGTTGTLLHIVDRTETAMGGRLLRRNLSSPFGTKEQIQERLGKVAFLYHHADASSSLRSSLASILDIERITSKLSVAKGNARDIIGLKKSLHEALRVRDVLRAEDEELFRSELESIADFSDTVELIDRAIDAAPPLSLHEGRIIRDGYSEQLDAYRNVGRENREWINQYQLSEQRRHGISSLKVRYNKIIGYYIEVTKPNLHLIPSHYIKKQTLINSERFTTEELEEHETLLREARDRSDSLEFELFEEIRGKILLHTEALFRAAEAIALVDVCVSLATVAKDNDYSEPDIVDENIVDIRDGRHPVVEALGEEPFIANDLELNDADRRIMILTGPNMAGKSTYLRQAALIIIMAHVGSFVPAKKARIGLVDRVFSRIGATDRLIKGESTFLVEMIETSRILHYATRRSFIIMDEIGRGTSTYDGLSIAWAVLEYLLERTEGAKVLFATHYHEITALRDSYGIVNCNVTVKEWNNSVIFLRKILPGSASKSYGIEVARMAGIPDSVIERAKGILGSLEKNFGGHIPLMLHGTIDKPERDQKQNSEGDGSGSDKQLDLFPSPYEILVKELGNVDIERITPLEALNILDRLKRSLTT